MSTPANALDITQAGLIRFDGSTTFSGVPTTIHDVLVGAASNGIISVGPGSAGQVLQSGGASADPTYSTATYPATAGTVGNVLTSDGTNLVSSAPQVQVITGTLTNAQIKALHATPVEAIAAPGANKVLSILSCTAHLVYGGTTPFTAAVGQSIQLWYNNNTANSLTNDVLSNGMITSVASKFSNSLPASLANQSVGSIDNVNVAFYNPTATEITGNAANDTTVNWAITYSIDSL